MRDLFVKFCNYYGTDISRGVTIGGREIRQESTRPSASTTLIKYERAMAALKKNQLQTKKHPRTFFPYRTSLMK